MKRILYLYRFAYLENYHRVSGAHLTLAIYFSTKCHPKKVKTIKYQTNTMGENKKQGN
jgi:hypothetical protein